MKQQVEQHMRERVARHDGVPVPVTLDDVALAAGVSTATVSRVINNFPRVADATRQRVLDAIERLHYTPNFTGRMLATQRTHTLGLIITDITNPFYPAVVRGMEAAALSHGLRARLDDTAENEQREAQALQLLRERRGGGVVICSPRLGTSRPAPRPPRKTPPVLTHHQPASPHLARV